MVGRWRASLGGQRPQFTAGQSEAIRRMPVMVSKWENTGYLSKSWFTGLGQGTGATCRRQRNEEVR